MRFRRYGQLRRGTSAHPHPNRPRRLLSLRRIEIPLDRYGADLELHDRFLQFSAELLRMALGGIAAIGFLVSLLVGKDALPVSVFRPAVYLPLAASISAFALAGGAALSHRFLAADGMFHHLRSIKQLILIEKIEDHSDLSNKVEMVRTTARRDEICRNRKFQTSEILLFASAILLFAGVVAFGGAVVAVLLGGPQSATIPASPNTPPPSEASTSKKG